MKDLFCILGLHNWKKYLTRTKDVYTNSFVVTEYFKCTKCDIKKQSSYIKGNWKCGSEIEDGPNYKNCSHC